MKPKKTYYNHETISFPANGAEKCSLKSICGEVVTVTASDGFFFFDTSGWQPGRYYGQTSKADRVIDAFYLDLKQNLAYSDADYDPRSEAERTLEAIDAMLSGRATAQQRKVQVGDKSIEYSSLDELHKWRDHFVKKVRTERGLAASPIRELPIMRNE